jgi:hypothetical protein
MAVPAPACDFTSPADRSTGLQRLAWPRTLSIRVSAPEYWIATHNPDVDEPLRRQALREAGGDPWRALGLLSDPDCTTWWSGGLRGAGQSVPGRSA